MNETLELTTAQEEALQRLFDRGPLYMYYGKPTGTKNYRGQKEMSYEEFHALIQPGYGCIMIPWCGMWLGIEPDGYTHS